MLTALAGSRWDTPPSLSNLIETALPGLGLQAFKTEIVRSRAWEHPDRWPVVGGVSERALHRVMPKRNAGSHQAPSLDDRQLVNAGWIVLLAVGHAAATDSRERWKAYVEDGRVPAERALYGEKDIHRTIEMPPPIVAPAPARPLPRSPEAGAPAGTVSGAVAPSRRASNARIAGVASTVAVLFLGLAVALALIPEPDPCRHAALPLDDAAVWLTGMDLRWTEPAAGFDARCPGHRADTLPCPIYSGRDLADSTQGILPGVVASRAEFDTRPGHGMFELTLQSTASVDVIEPLIARRFGPPTSRNGPRATWVLGEVHLLLLPTPARVRATGAASSVVTSYDRASDAYYERCPR